MNGRRKFGLSVLLLTMMVLGLSTVGLVVARTDSVQIGRPSMIQSSVSRIGTVDLSGQPLVHQIQTDSGVNMLLPSGFKSPSSFVLSVTASSVVSNTSFVINSPGFSGLSNAAPNGPYVPSDVQIASGPNYLMEMVNSYGEIFTKQGTPVQSADFRQMFNIPQGYAPIDPKVLYDNSSQRWFASVGIIETNVGYPDNVTLAVSTDSNPFTWNLYDLCPGPTTGGCGTLYPDQPILGVSDDKVTLSVNDFSIFGCPPGELMCWAGAQFWVLNKMDLLSGSNTVGVFRAGPYYSMGSIHPVQSLSPTTTQYMVNTPVGNANSVTLWSVTGVPCAGSHCKNPVQTSSTVLSLTGSPAAPPGAVQKGTSWLLDTGDNRVQSAVWFQGKLWYSINDGCLGSYSCARLTEIDTVAVRVNQDFEVGASGYYFFYPALSIDSGGNLDVIYGFSSANDYPSLAITGQSSYDQPRTLAPAVTILKGQYPAIGGCDSTTGICRYGDYFGAAVDPSNPTGVWVAGQTGANPQNAYEYWSTFIASMKLNLRDFSMSTNCDYISYYTCAQSTITVNSVNGFSGSVKLSATASPRTGITMNLSSSSVAVPAGGNANSTLSVTTSCKFTSCSWVVTVTGTSGPLTHSISIDVCRGKVCPQAVIISQPSTTSPVTGTAILAIPAPSLRVLTSTQNTQPLANMITPETKPNVHAHV